MGKINHNRIHRYNILTLFLNRLAPYVDRMSEAHLVKQAKAGDFDAFMQLVSEQKAKLYNLALKMTGNETDAEDVVQDTLVKAIDKIETFRGESAFGTWLYAIALNEARAVLAKRKHADLKPLEEYLPGGGQMDMHGKEISNKLFDWEDPHQRLESSELRRLINKGIEELPPMYREVFLLRYHEELSIKEIAKLVNESEAAVKSRVLRARLAMRDFLSKAFEESYGKQVPRIH